MDMHVHLAGNGTNLVRILMTPPSLVAARTRCPTARSTLAAGVTTVRDAGNTPVGVRLAAEAGYFPAPRMELGDRLLSQTGGHGDDLMPCGSRVGLVSASTSRTASSTASTACVTRCGEVLQAGADWIKLCTSGGVLSAGDLPDHPQFSIDEIRVAVEEAAAVGKRVAAHAMSAGGDSQRAARRGHEHRARVPARRGVHRADEGKGGVPGPDARRSQGRRRRCEVRAAAFRRR